MWETKAIFTDGFRTKWIHTKPYPKYNTKPHPEIELHKHFLFRARWEIFLALTVTWYNNTQMNGHAWVQHNYLWTLNAEFQRTFICPQIIFIFWFVLNSLKTATVILSLWSVQKDRRWPGLALRSLPPAPPPRHLKHRYPGDSNTMSLSDHSW